MQIITADLCDQYRSKIDIFPLDLINFGTKENFSGKVITVKVYEDNSYVKKLLEQNGKGKVLVIDGGGSRRCALVGDNLAKLAIQNQWEGIIVYGCIRDSREINTLSVAIKALGTCPVKSLKRNIGIIGEQLLIQGVKINNDQYIYGDSDGILISHKNLLPDNE